MSKKARLQVQLNTSVADRWTSYTVEWSSNHGDYVWITYGFLRFKSIDSVEEHFAIRVEHVVQFVMQELSDE